MDPRVIISRTLSIGLSILLRAGLLLFLSGLVYTLSAPEDTKVFFQIVFLQAIVIAFLSASGFFRAQALKDDGEAADYLAAMVLLIVPSLALPLLLAVLDQDYSGRLLALMAIWSGAVATALATPLSALVMTRLGPFRAFLPACISATVVLFALWLAAERNWFDLLPYVALASFQILNFTLLALQQRSLIVAALRRLFGKKLKELKGYVLEGFGVGASNVAHLLVVLAVREIWSDSVSDELAAALFFVLRVSDTGLQLLHMVLSKNALVERLIEIGRAPVLQAISFSLAIGIAVVVSRWGISGDWHPLALAVGMHLAVDLARYPWSLSFLYQMHRFRMHRYLAFTLAPPVIALVVAAPLLIAGAPMALTVFMAIITWSGSTITALQARRNA